MAIETESKQVTPARKSVSKGSEVASQARTGCDAIIDTLQKGGVEVMFGYSGGGTMFLINSMVAANMTNVGGRTELGSAWMSYGYNRIKRRAASVCLFHCVGALHASPVIMAAKVDSTPFMMMDVNLSSSLDMREGLQDSAELYSALKPISKYIRKVVTAEDLPLAVRQALLAAGTGRQGPAVLDLAFQVLMQETKCKTEALELPERPGTNKAALERAMTMIRAARKPVIMVGAGVHISDAAPEVARLAELLGIPVITTSWGGRGTLPDQHPLFAGVMGSFGWTSANEMIQVSDLWIAIGTTFSQMSTGAWSIDRPQNTIQIDIDPQQLGKIFQPTLGIVGDAKVVIEQLMEAFNSSGWSQPDVERNPWIQQMRVLKKDWFDYHATLGADSGSPVNQYYLINEMSKVFPAGTLIIGDSGGNAFMVYRSFEYQDVTQMACGSRYMSLGASLPIAIGAKLAAPDKVVVSYHGDGGFFYDFNELSTLAQYKVKVIIILDNNGCLLANRAGMRMWGFENPWAELPPDTDYVGVAKALGVEGEVVSRPEEIAPALQRALAAAGSYLIDVKTDPDTRIRRAIKDVVPILSDRPPSPGAEKHIGPPLEDSWPN